MIIGTGNHLVIDVLVGWMIVALGWALAEALGRIPLYRAVRRLWHRRTPDDRRTPDEPVVTIADPAEPEKAAVVE